MQRHSRMLTPASPVHITPPFTSTPEQRKEILQMVVDEVIVHRNDNVDITLAIPIETEPTTEDSVSVQTLANNDNFRTLVLRFTLAV